MEPPRRRLEELSAVAAFTIGFPLANGDALAGRISDLLWHAAGKGVTLLHDCGIGSIDGASDLEILQTVIGADSPVRYRGMLVSSAYNVWSKMGLKPGCGDDLFRVNGIKAWSDGSNQAGTGFQREPYLGSELRGALNYSRDELAEAALRAITIDAAWQCDSDDITGSIEVGKFADLVMLEEDPTRVDSTTISKIVVSQTWLAGEVRFAK